MATALAMAQPANIDALNALPSIYAAPGKGDCMEPLISADARGLTFDKEAVPQPGDVVVLWFTPVAATRIGHSGWVKRLVKPLPPRGQVGLIVVEMLNPHRVLTLRSDEVIAVHKCIAHASPVNNTLSAIGAPLSLPAPTEIRCPPTSDHSSPLALRLFDRLDGLPHRYFVHLAEDNRNAPLIRAGEVVVIDQGGVQQGGWIPTEGGLFLIEYRGKLTDYPDQRYPRVTRDIVQTYTDGRGRWHVGSLRRGSSVGGMFFCSDGPYRDEMQLADKLIGRVVGIAAQTMGGNA